MRGLVALRKLLSDVKIIGHSDTEIAQPSTSFIPPQHRRSPSRVDIENGSFLRKDFRISGQVEEPGHKDKLSFASLAHQTEEGQRKNMPDEEITEAVIRAIQPGLSLRGYLESLCGLTMASLRKILRSHYREGQATDLYHHLSNGSQEPKETPLHL